MFITNPISLSKKPCIILNRSVNKDTKRAYFDLFTLFDFLWMVKGPWGLPAPLIMRGIQDFPVFGENRLKNKRPGSLRKIINTKHFTVFCFGLTVYYQ